MENVDPIAWADQNAEGYKQLARVHAAFFKGLLDEDIPQEVAIEQSRALIMALHGHKPGGSGHTENH